MLNLVIIDGISLERICKGIRASPRRWRPMPLTSEETAT